MVMATAWQMPVRGAVNLYGVSSTILVRGNPPWTVRRVFVVKISESPLYAFGSVPITAELRGDGIETARWSVDHPVADWVTQANSTPYIELNAELTFEMAGSYSYHFVISGEEKARVSFSVERAI